MNKSRNYFLFILGMIPSFTVAFMSAFIVGARYGKVYSELSRPPFSPPGFFFPIVWTLLYVLMGVATYRILISRAFREEKQMAVAIYIAQLSLNFLWSIVFFCLQLFLISFLICSLLWFMIFINLIVYIRIDRLSGRLLLPYLLWVAYALYLIFGIILLN